METWFQFQSYKKLKVRDDTKRPIKFFDTMGLEASDEGIETEVIGQIMDGQVKNGADVSIDYYVHKNKNKLHISATNVYI